MCKLSCWALCVVLTFAIPSAAAARGGTYYHAEFVPFSSITATKEPANGSNRRHHYRCFKGVQPRVH
jgi:hypothetical protein